MIRAHYFARSLILLGFALFIAHLSKAGALKYYIAPSMEPYIRYCPIALVLMAVALAYQALFQKPPSSATASARCPRQAGKTPRSTACSCSRCCWGRCFPIRRSAAPPPPKRDEPDLPLSAAEQLEATFKAPDPYNAEFAELAKRLYPEEIIEIRPEIFSETVGAIELFQDQFRGKKSN